MSDRMPTFVVAMLIAWGITTGLVIEHQGGPVLLYVLLGSILNVSLYPVVAKMLNGPRGNGLDSLGR